MESQQEANAPQKEAYKEASKEVLGAFKTCLDLASTILSVLPIQAPKAAVDSVKQMVTNIEARSTSSPVSPTNSHPSIRIGYP
jgi:hypothetical protein